MTQIDEIKERLAANDKAKAVFADEKAVHSYEYELILDAFAETAPEDIRYLLAQVEQLQRAKELLDASE